GLQLRLASERRIYRAGEELGLRVFARNLTAKTMALHALDRVAVDVSIKGEVVEFTLATLDAQIVDVPPRQAAYWTIDQPPQLAPGNYKVRVLVISPERPAGERVTWHGRVVSNEEPMEIR